MEKKNHVLKSTQQKDVQYFGLAKDFSFGNIIAIHTHTQKGTKKGKKNVLLKTKFSSNI